MVLRMAGWQRKCSAHVWRRWRHSTSRRRFGRSETVVFTACGLCIGFIHVLALEFVDDLLTPHFTLVIFLFRILYILLYYFHATMWVIHWVLAVYCLWRDRYWLLASRIFSLHLYVHSSPHCTALIYYNGRIPCACMHVYICVDAYAGTKHHQVCIYRFYRE